MPYPSFSTMHCCSSAAQGSSGAGRRSETMPKKWAVARPRRSRNCQQLVHRQTSGGRTGRCAGIQRERIVTCKSCTIFVPDPGSLWHTTPDLCGTQQCCVKNPDLLWYKAYPTQATSQVTCRLRLCLPPTCATSGLVGARNTMALTLPAALAAAAAGRCCCWITRAAMSVLPEPALQQHTEVHKCTTAQCFADESAVRAVICAP